MPDVKELFEEQKKTWEDYKTAQDKALDKKSAEFEEKASKFEAKMTELEKKIDDEQKAQKKALDDAIKHTKDLEAKLGRSFSEPQVERKSFMSGPVGGTLYNRYKRENPMAMKAVWDELARPGQLDDERKAALVDQQKTMSIKDPETGGYLAEAQWIDGMIKDVREVTPVLELAKVVPITRDTVMVRRKTGTITALRRSELGSKTATTGLKFTVDQMTVGEIYAYDDVTMQDLEQPDFDLAGELQEEFRDAFSAKIGSEFISGDAVDASEGFLTNAAILAAYVASGAASAMKANTLIDLLEAGLKEQYRKNQVVVCNRSTLAKIRQLTDGAGQYLWAPGLGVMPNTICGYPYRECPDMDNVGAGKYPLAAGDFKNGYLQAVKIAIAIKRIEDSTLDAAGTVRFSGRMVTRGFVTNTNAIKVLKIAAS